jgi:hypothetical protein
MYPYVVGRSQWYDDDDEFSKMIQSIDGVTPKEFVQQKMRRLSSAALEKAG